MSSMRPLPLQNASTCVHPTKGGRCIEVDPLGFETSDCRIGDDAISKSASHNQRVVFRSPNLPSQVCLDMLSATVYAILRLIRLRKKSSCFRSATSKDNIAFFVIFFWRRVRTDRSNIALDVAVVAEELLDPCRSDIVD